MVAEGIEKVSRARRAAKDGKPRLDNAPPTPGEADTETETETDKPPPKKKVQKPDDNKQKTTTTPINTSTFANPPPKKEVQKPDAGVAEKPSGNPATAPPAEKPTPIGTSTIAQSGVDNLRKFVSEHPINPVDAGVAEKPSGNPATAPPAEKPSSIPAAAPPATPKPTKKRPPPSDIYGETNGSLRQKAHVLYTKVTSQDKNEFKDGMGHVEVRPSVVNTAMRRAKENWRDFVPKHKFPEVPVGDLPDCIREDTRTVNSDRPRTKDHYIRRHRSVKINVLIDDVDILNSARNKEDKKRAWDNWEEFFPITDAMGLDDEPVTKKKQKKKGKNNLPMHDEETLRKLDAENRQVEKLVWYTKSDQVEHYRGLLRMEDNSTKDIALTSDWCNLNFNPLFLELVKLSGRRWPSKKKWVPIPAGSSKDGLMMEPTNLIDFVRSIKSVYQQGADDTCLIHSFCSALHYVGMVDEACKLERYAKDYESLPCDAQVRKLVGHVKTKIPIQYIREIETTMKAKSACKIDIYSPDDNSINVVVLQTTDGAADHAITTVKLGTGGPIVFDSNDSFAMKLNMKTLNHCSGPHADYLAVRQHIRIRVKPKNIEKDRTNKLKKVSYE
jgi:hypothetical protein